MDVTSVWYWEGNVVEALATHLLGTGWAMVSKADTQSKERGVDIHVVKDGRALLIEAKGYPSVQYRDPSRAHEQKRTNPVTQAQHWYAQALLKTLRLQGKYPEAQVALAFPDFPRYRTLFAETRSGLERLGIALLFVRETGEVDAWGIDAWGIDAWGIDV